MSFALVEPAIQLRSIRSRVRTTGRCLMVVGGVWGLMPVFSPSFEMVPVALLCCAQLVSIQVGVTDRCWALRQP